jgi:hypothetical protein
MRAPLSLSSPSSVTSVFTVKTIINDNHHYYLCDDRCIFFDKATVPLLKHSDGSLTHGLQLSLVQSSVVYLSIQGCDTMLVPHVAVVCVWLMLQMCLFQFPYGSFVAAEALVSGTGSPCEVAANDGTCYGHALKEKYFFLGQGFTNLNHGSFGTVARPVASAQRDLFLEQEALPDTWFRVSYFNYVAQSRRVLADLINATVDDVVLVENASSAVNSLLRSLNLQRGDKVLRLSTAYGMVINTLNWLHDVAGIEIVTVDVSFPMQDDTQLLMAVQAAYDAHPDIRLSVFSHISSMPAVIEPITELTNMARKVSSLVLIDGAHAPGVLDIDITAVNPDFYLGNCHKWLFAPKVPNKIEVSLKY